MQIEYKPCRKLVIRISVIFSILLAGLQLFLIITMIIGSESFYGDFGGALFVLILGIIFQITSIAIALVAKFSRGGDIYSFTKDEISMRNRGKTIEKIAISDIKCIRYYKFKFHYLLGALPEFGCWKLHVWLNDGTYKELGLFAFKIVKSLQEQLYSDLITIY